ncbi:hypothetical protein BOTBODRAFT_55911 [Botryobasidium botryosum FD-172 SS1]|uniref:Major facilitator superfamily (MFS) profile domain-containing protein n=1 Tax=Botryobasidium botryosum (strain FD-172 SS1) TaxID=930990 RepID=A0A067MDM0_BOTB1|nr:hypothetical protein BOTBODRAFT_55911 [Botryobasidium botryosum FD-172 SS1]
MSLEPSSTKKSVPDSSPLGTPANSPTCAHPGTSTTASGPTTKAREDVFSRRQKRFIVFLISMVGLFSPLASNIYIPALPLITKALNTTEGLINLTITIYLVFQGLSPTFWASLADSYGRRRFYIGTMTVFIAACIGLGETNSLAPMLVLRAIQACGASSVISIGAGIVGDISTPAERGSYMGWYGVGNFIGPCVGPVLGGVLAQTLGYHSVFWFLAISGGVATLFLFVFLPETHPSITGDGSILPAKSHLSMVQLLFYRDRRAKEIGDVEKDDQSALERMRAWEATKPPRRKLNFLTPFKYLIEWDIFLVCAMSSFIYAAYYALLTTQPQLFSDIYHLTELQIGLTFIPGGVGGLIGTVLGGKVVDYYYRYYARLEVAKGRTPSNRDEPNGTTENLERGNPGAELEDGTRPSTAASKLAAKAAPSLHFPIEKARLRAMPAYLFVFCASIVSYGWVVKQRVHLAVPLIFQFINAYCLTGVFAIVNTLLVDLCPGSSASVTATLNVARCTLGAAATAVVSYILAACGAGWTFVIFAALCIVVCTPSIWAVGRWGSKQRAKRARAAQK